jgi:hypothetical protein
MAAHTIRLAFLWADEAAVVQDFNMQYSARLVGWARAFYRRYGFELDVAPRLGTSARDAYRYCLDKSEGYEPDVNDGLSYLAHRSTLELPQIFKANAADKEIARLEPEEAAKREELAAAIALLGSLPPAAQDAQAARIELLHTELKAIAASLAAERRSLKEATEMLAAIRRRFAAEEYQRNFDLRAREAIGRRVRESRGRADPFEDAIADPYRLKVLFCRFRRSPTVMSLSRGTQPFGATRRYLGADSVDGRHVYGGYIILINLNPNLQELITLAHELIHAADIWHPPDVKRLRTIEERMRGAYFDTRTQKVVVPPLYEMVEGAYYDGPDDSILNANSKGMSPDRVRLLDEHRDALIAADFVRPPPAP